MIKPIVHSGRTFYCCNPRTDPDNADASQRDPISKRQAQDAVNRYVAQLGGAETTAQELAQITGGMGTRVFGMSQGKPFCTCPAFPAARQCLHTLGLSLFLGTVEAPDTVDQTPLAPRSRGNKPRAPPRGAVPLKADEKDAKIVELQAQVAKLKKTQASTGKPNSAWISKLKALPSPTDESNQATAGRGRGMKRPASQQRRPRP
eukprot:7641325-Karenia_brevis.AAC.1